MIESPPSPLTVYTDPDIGLTVTAWPKPESRRSVWLVHFHRWSHKAARNLLDQTAEWLPCGGTFVRGQNLGWNVFYKWDPIRHHLIPPAALAAVEAWLAEQAKEVGE